MAQLDYYKSVSEYVTPEERELTAQLLLSGYDIEIQRMIEDPNCEIKENLADRVMIETIAAWLSRDPMMIKSPLILNRADVTKNLLIIGGYGNGKTTALRIMSMIASKTKKPIKYLQTKEVVDKYDGITGPSQKVGFWNEMKAHDRIFDDLMSERQASNYGKVELFTDILEARDNVRKCRTVICCNPPAGANYKETLFAIGERYGGRVYDRLHIYNHIFVKAKSLRN